MRGPSFRASIAAGAVTLLTLALLARVSGAVDAAGDRDDQAPDGGSSRDSGAHSTDLPLSTPEHCPAGMAYVPARAWSREYGPSAETPATHAFCMDILETTHADYAKCVTADQCAPLAFEGRWATRPRYPVLHATFKQAKDYCHFRKKRIATPNEWVRAAGGDKETWNPWGDKWPDDMSELCTGKGHPCNVGTSSKDVSQFGIRDMALNAREWVLGRLPYRKGFRAGEDWKYSSMKTTAIYVGGWNSGIRCAADPMP